MKKLFPVLIVFCIVTFFAVQNYNVKKNSLLLFANVEALASNEEEGVSISCKGQAEMGECVVYCVPCNQELRRESGKKGPASASGKCPYCGKEL